MSITWIFFIVFVVFIAVIIFIVLLKLLTNNSVADGQADRGGLIGSASRESSPDINASSTSNEGSSINSTLTGVSNPNFGPPEYYPVVPPDLAPPPYEVAIKMPQ